MDKNHIVHLLENHGIELKPELDQHFMLDDVMIEKIIETAEIGKNDTVFEIGSGIGTLTKEIAKKSKKVIAVEFDKRFEPVAYEITKDLKNIEFVWGNALKEIEHRDFDVLISNTPYSICEALMQRLIYKKFRSAVLSVPKKFSEILFAKKGDKRYSKLSLIVNAFFKIELKYSIPKDAFYPIPKMKSVIIKITPLNMGYYKKHKEKYILTQIFLHKKRKLKNAIREAIISFGELENRKITKRQAKGIVKNLGNIPERFERLKLEDFESLIYKLKRSMF
jgi:16S rRNA (adenine1518-N6/adenine1519-N6)-dimethyltransferase